MQLVVVRTLVMIGVLGYVACSSRMPNKGNGVSCGPGTTLVGSTCEIIRDAGMDARSLDAQLDAAPDAGPTGTAATTIGIDPAHDNAQPSDQVTSPLTPLWTERFTGTVSYPLVVNEVVFIAVAGPQPSVRALDIKTGATLWGPQAVGSNPALAYDAGRVFALDLYGHMTAFDAATGTQLWSVQVPNQSFYYAPPIAVGGLIYANGVGSAGTITAIDEQTGAVRWMQQTGGTDGCPAVVNGIVYVDEACEFLAFDAVAGTLLWSHQLPCTGGGGWAPSVYGTKIWDRGTFGNLILEHDGTLLGTFAANVMPAFHDGLAFYRTNGALSAVDIATSTLRWRFTGDGQLCTTPVVAGAGGQVFVGSEYGNVYELDALTGSQRSVYAVGTQLTCFSEANAPALADGHLLVPAGNELVVF